MALLFVTLETHQFKCHQPDILDKRTVDRAKMDLSAQQSVFDIDGILMWQTEKRYRFGAKNGGKMAHYTYSSSRSQFPTLPIIYQPVRI